MAVIQTVEASAESHGRETIEGLFATLESPLLTYSIRLTGERGLAEDIVQEAFMKLHSQFDLVREPRRWLYRTVHNLALNQRRQSEKIVSLHPTTVDEQAPDTDAADTAPLPDEQIIRLEGIGQVQLCLETLDERSRELIRLKFNEELSYKDISERTGLTVTNVGFLLHRALKSIASELAETGMMK